jgi:hypothetical protein
METGQCPICCELIQRLERYPKTVCKDCVEKAVDSRGLRVRFQTGLSGFGFESHHTTKTTKTSIKNEHTCYIDGKKCYADESRFGGGIVVEME